jgi:ribosome maturation factor RimP
MNSALQALLLQEVEALGFDLVEVRRGGTGGRPLIAVRIDRRDGSRVTVDDCAGVSRVLEPRLDASGLVGAAYVLEVSSPGVERPLRHAADWRRFTGRRASVLCERLGGRVEVDIVGVEREDEREIVIVRDRSGRETRCPLDEVKGAHLVLVWK